MGLGVIVRLSGCVVGLVAFVRMCGVCVAVWRESGGVGCWALGLGDVGQRMVQRPVQGLVLWGRWGRVGE